MQWRKHIFLVLYGQVFQMPEVLVQLRCLYLFVESHYHCLSFLQCSQDAWKFWWSTSVAPYYAYEPSYCQLGMKLVVRIVREFDVPCLSMNLLSVSQLTQTGKIVEFQTNRLFMKNLKDKFIVVDGLLDPIDHLYKFCDQPQLESGPTALIAQADEHSKIWHE